MIAIELTEDEALAMRDVLRGEPDTIVPYFEGYGLVNTVPLNIAERISTALGLKGRSGRIE